MAKKDKNKPQLDPRLDGFNITINAFGEIKSTMDIRQLNEFLDENVADKKLVDRDDHVNKQLKDDYDAKKEEENQKKKS
jgi:hypothetical protein